MRPSPARGRGARVYGCLDGNRDFWGCFGAWREMTLPPLPLRGETAESMVASTATGAFWVCLGGEGAV